MFRKAVVVSLVLSTAIGCSRDNPSPSPSISPADGLPAFEQAKNDIATALVDVAIDSGPILGGDSSQLSLMPVATPQERAEASELLTRLRSSLGGIDPKGLPANEAAEHAALLSVLGPADPSPSAVAPTDPEHLASQFAMELALAQRLAAGSNGAERAASASEAPSVPDFAERVLRFQAQQTAWQERERQYLTCMTARAVLLSAVQAEDEEVGREAGSMSRAMEDQLRAAIPANGICVEVIPEGQGRGLSPSNPAALREDWARLQADFRPALDALALPPADLVPLETLVRSDPLFAATSERTAASVIEEAAGRPDRWLTPLLREIFGESAQATVVSDWGGLDLVDADALLVEPSAGSSYPMLFLDAARLEGRRDWEAAGVVVDALVAACFRQRVLQLTCAENRIAAARRFFAPGRYDGDPRLAVGVLLRLRSYLGLSAALASSPGSSDPPIAALTDGLGRFTSEADRQGLASVVARVNQSDL